MGPYEKFQCPPVKDRIYARDENGRITGPYWYRPEDNKKKVNI